MKTAVLASLFALVSVMASASTVVIFGFEDTPIGGDLDYNDAFGTITGATLHTSTGVFSSLTAGLINDSGNVFWDHVSLDGPNDNIGNIWLTDDPGAQYLAKAGGGLVSDVWFSGGSTVTIVGGITADTDTIKVCYVANCSATLQTVAGSLTWTPTQAWELVGAVAGGGTYYSDPNEDHKSSFAFAEVSNVPEPNVAWLGVFGLALLLCGSARHWRASR